MKPVVGIFAHPDDEAFFTGGTIATLSPSHDVYTICVTNGDAGENSLAKPDIKSRNLSEIRKVELLESGKVLGVKETFFFGYGDGTLSNRLYHEIARKIQEIVDKLKPDILITFEPRGISGHLDHIAVSMITSYVFEKSPTVREIWYYCNSEKIPTVKDYFIYWPPGYKQSEISKTINTDPVWDIKVEAMHKHASQMHDVKRILARYKNLPKEENFIIVKK